MAIEFELKYRASWEALEEIALAMGPGERVYEMQTAYYVSKVTSCF